MENNQSNERISVEHAIYISRIDDLKHAFSRSFQRVYFGCESCHLLMPSVKQVETILSFCSHYKMEFSLVTPFLPESGFDDVKELLNVLPKGTEIIINDWGLLGTATKLGLKPVAGRLLVRVKRDPRIRKADLEKPQFANYLRSSNLGSRAFQKVLHQFGFDRVELDNVVQGYELELPSSLETSLYYPFVYASVTRRCAEIYGNADSGTPSCRLTCGQKLFSAKTKSEQGVDREEHGFHIQGALSFFNNSQMPKQTQGWNLSRYVYMPRPPTAAQSRVGSKSFGDWNGIHETLGKDVPWGYEKPEQQIIYLLDKHCAPDSDQKLMTLDLGCGNGRNAIPLMKLGYSVVGMDLSKAALLNFVERVPEAGVARADCLNLPLESNSFDVVVDYGCFHAIMPQNHASCAREIERVLRPGGKFILIVRSRDESHQLNEPVYFVNDILPEWGFTLSQLEALFLPGLSILETCRIEGHQDEVFCGCVFGFTNPERI